MAYKLPPLSWLRAFEASARLCSFTAAAEELNLTQAAISNQVRSLEQHLGYALFERLSRSLKLTDMGRAYLPPVRKAFDELSDTTMGLFGQQGKSSVTIRAPISFAVLWLAPRLDQFRAQHPDIEIRLWSAIWAERLAADRPDLDIRFGDGKWEGYVSRLMMHEDALPVCSTDMADQFSDPDGVIPRESLLHILGLEDMWRSYFSLTGQENTEIPPGFSMDTSLAALELAVNGGKAVIALESFAAPYLASGRLTVPNDIRIPIEQSHYLLLPEEVNKPRPEVKLLMDWLLKEARNWSLEEQLNSLKG